MNTEPIAFFSGSVHRVKPRYRRIHSEAGEICLYGRTKLRYDKENIRGMEEIETSVRDGERGNKGRASRSRGNRVRYVFHYKKKSSYCRKGIRNSLKLTTLQVRQSI